MQKYRPDIDGLRAVAVLPVVFFHAHISGFSGGYVGVDVFFVISGYLITSIIYSEISNGKFSILNFYERRIRRILPALFAVIIFSTAVGYFLLLPDEMKAFGRSVVATILFSSNLLFWRESGYFDGDAETKPLLHTWSLAVEEQFYIVFPIALLTCTRYLPRHVPWTIATAAICSFLLAVVAQRWPDANFYLPFFRAWELLVGAFLALHILPPPPRTKILRDGLALIGLSALCLSIFLYDQNTPFPGTSALPPVLGTACIIYAGIDGSSYVKRLLSRPELVFAGLVSYSLYLWHWPLLVFARMIAMKDLSNMEASAAIAVAFIFAVLSWRYIERPFRRRTTLAGHSKLFSTSLASMACFIAIGSILVATKGLPQRIPQRAIEISKTASEDDNFSHQYDCVAFRFIKTQNYGPCYIGGTSKPTIAVWGDSHAMALKPMFDELLKGESLSGLLVSAAGCPPIFEIARIKYSVPCALLSDKFFSFLKSSNIKKIIVVGSWNGIFFDKDTALRGRASFDDKTRYENIRLGLNLTFKRLSENGIQIAFMMPVPGAKEAVPQTVVRSIMLGREASIEYSQTEYAVRAELLRKILTSTPDPVDVVIDVQNYLCDKTCHAMRDGRALYFDESHPSLYLNELLLPIVKNQLAVFINETSL